MDSYVYVILCFVRNVYFGVQSTDLLKKKKKNLWNFLSDEIKVSFVIYYKPSQPVWVFINTVTFEKQVGNLRIEATCQGNQDEVVRTLSPTPRGLNSSRANHLIRVPGYRSLPQNLKGWVGLESLRAGEHWRCWERGAPSESELRAPFLTPCPVQLSFRLFLSYVSCSSKLREPKERIFSPQPMRQKYK